MCEILYLIPPSHKPPPPLFLPSQAFAPQVGAVGVSWKEEL